jgi:hypothetical protein
MQRREFEREAGMRLPSLLASLLCAPSVEVEPDAGYGLLGGAGYDLRIAAGGRQWLAEVKSSSTPAVVASAAERLERYAGLSEKLGVPLLVVPYMTPAGARLAAERGLNWIDLSGNARLRDGELYVWVEGRPNQFPLRGRPSSAFAPKSARISRVLLLEPSRWWRQKDLARKSGLDDGHLSRVVRRLGDEGFLEYRAGEFRPREPQMLLDAWADAYRFDRHDIVTAHMSGSGNELSADLHQRLVAAGVDHAFTGLSAAWEMAHHARYRLNSVYVSGDPRAAIEAAGLRRSDRGANVQVIGPDDEGVFAGVRTVERLPCVSAPQVYLDLLNLPERAREAADQLRSDGLLWDRDD